MIYGNLDSVNDYIFDERLKMGFDFLLNNDLTSFKKGRTEIDGENIFANFDELTTKNQSLKKWEAHRKYIDIQYVIKGEEKMGFGLKKDFKTIITPYDEEKDVEFSEGKNFNFINVKEGEFVVFYPNDVHAPMLSVDKDIQIKKVIVKIKL